MSLHHHYHTQCANLEEEELQAVKHFLRLGPDDYDQYYITEGETKFGILETQMSNDEMHSITALVQLSKEH